MAQKADRHTDERFNELSDSDSFWGPLIGFRPEQRRCISNTRALSICLMLGAFYGLLLDLILVLICRSNAQPVPPVFVMPTILTLTYFVIFQFTLGPAWNRRARLIVRREGYLESLRRDSH